MIFFHAEIAVYVVSILLITGFLSYNCVRYIKLLFDSHNAKYDIISVSNRIYNCF